VDTNPAYNQEINATKAARRGVQDVSQKLKGVSNITKLEELTKTLTSPASVYRNLSIVEPSTLLTEIGKTANAWIDSLSPALPQSMGIVKVMAETTFIVSQLDLHRLFSHVMTSAYRVAVYAAPVVREWKGVAAGAAVGVIGTSLLPTQTSHRRQTDDTRSCLAERLHLDLLDRSSSISMSGARADDVARLHQAEQLCYDTLPTADEIYRAVVPPRSDLISLKERSDAVDAALIALLALEKEVSDASEKYYPFAQAYAASIAADQVKAHDLKKDALDGIVKKGVLSGDISSEEVVSKIAVLVEPALLLLRYKEGLELAERQIKLEEHREQEKRDRGFVGGEFVERPNWLKTPDTIRKSFHNGEASVAEAADRLYWHCSNDASPFACMAFFFVNTLRHLLNMVGFTSFAAVEGGYATMMGGVYFGSIILLIFVVVGFMCALSFGRDIDAAIRSKISFLGTLEPLLREGAIEHNEHARNFMAACDRAYEAKTLTNEAAFEIHTLGDEWHRSFLQMKAYERSYDMMKRTIDALEEIKRRGTSETRLGKVIGTTALQTWAIAWYAVGLFSSIGGQTVRTIDGMPILLDVTKAHKHLWNISKQTNSLASNHAKQNLVETIAHTEAVLEKDTARLTSNFATMMSFAFGSQAKVDNVDAILKEIYTDLVEVQKNVILIKHGDQLEGKKRFGGPEAEKIAMGLQPRLRAWADDNKELLGPSRYDTFLDRLQNVESVLASPVEPFRRDGLERPPPS
jgi:hypothetical protein